MGSQLPPAGAHDVRLLPVWRANAADVSKDGGDQARQLANDNKEPASLVQPLVSGELLVEIDVAAGRFVHMVRDPDTKEVLKQYPSEGQLAFSRAIGAYLQALRNGET